MSLFNLLLDILTLPFYLFFFLIIGKFFYGNFSKSFEDDFVNSFVEIIFGFILTVCCYALFKTGGKSIMLLFLLLMIIPLFHLKLRPLSNWFEKISKTDFKILGLIFGFVLVYFAVQLYRQDYFNPEIMKLGWGDYGYYSDLAESFNIYGLEKGNSWYTYFNSSSVSYNYNPDPYHYFEIWTQALFLNTTLNSGVIVFIYMLTPFVCSLVATSFFILGRIFLKNLTVKKNILLVITAIMMPFFVGKLPFLLGGYEDNVFYYPRNYMFFILFIFFVISFRLGHKGFGIYFIAALSCINILYLPTVSIVLVLLGIFRYYVKKENKMLALHTILLGVFPTIFIFLFYYVLFKSDGGGGFKVSVFNNIEAYIRTGIRYYFRLQLARIWFFYLPCFLVFLLYIWNNYKNIKPKSYINEIILVAVSLELVSLLFASFVPHLEAGTFNSIVLNPMLAVLSFMAIIYMINYNRSLIKKILLSILYVQVVYSVFYVMFNIGERPYEGESSFGKDFLQEVSNLDLKNKVGGFNKNLQNRDKSEFAAKSNLSWFSAIFDLKGNGYFQVDLTTFIEEKDIQFESIKEVEMNTPMFKYGNSKLQENGFYSRDSIDLSFISDYKIDYVILQPNVSVPDYLIPKIKKVVEDPYSKVKVVILN